MTQRPRSTPRSTVDYRAPRTIPGIPVSSYDDARSFDDALAAEPYAFPGEVQAAPRQVSQAVRRMPPTAETEDAVRSMLDEHLSAVVAEAKAEGRAEVEQRLQQALTAEAAARESLEQALATESSDANLEALKAQLVELAEQLEAAEARAVTAEQQAFYAGQQAGQAQQLLQATGASTSPTVGHDAAELPARRPSLAAWSGWCVAVLAAALATAGYFTSYRPQRERVAAQTKLLESQASHSRETEAALRRSFDREREGLHEQLNAARAAAEATANATAGADPNSADGDGAAAAAKADKLEARAAKQKARLEKKAERAAKHKAQAAGSTDRDKSDKSPASEPKHKAKPAARDTGDDLRSNDPLEGL